MSLSNALTDSTVKKINIVCLLFATIIILVFPVRKEIWYDETVSILCSKGITHDAASAFASSNTTNSASLEQWNNANGVFKATISDNGNSLLYNMGLHWFSLLFGNSLKMYVLFSQLCGIATMLAFFLLCRQLFGNSIFTSLALLLLVTDNNFLGMTHEVRAYALTVLFVTLAALHLFRYLYQVGSTKNLFFTGLFSACAILTHFLSVYIVAVFLLALLVSKGLKLFTWKNILAMLIPVGMLAAFFLASYKGLQQINAQNQQIHDRLIAQGFSIAHVFFRSLDLTAINFKAVFPAFAEKNPVILVSILLVALLYIVALKATQNLQEKRNLHLLFALGISGTLFLALLSIKAHHYTSLYFRYFSFCLPFCSLFTAYALYIVTKQPKINLALKGAAITIMTIPACLFFVAVLWKGKPRLNYNHVAVARTIPEHQVTKIEAPQWYDIFLIHSLLPHGYNIDYVVKPATTNFTLYKPGSADTIAVIRNNT